VSNAGIELHRAHVGVEIELDSVADDLRVAGELGGGIRATGCVNRLAVDLVRRAE
jgi:hypothetical protein